MSELFENPEWKPSKELGYTDAEWRTILDAVKAHCRANDTKSILSRAELMTANPEMRKPNVFATVVTELGIKEPGQ